MGRKNLGVFGGYFAKQCPEFVRKEYSSLYSNDLKEPDSPVVEARKQDGIKFEADLIETLRQLHAGDSGVVFLDSPADRSDRDQMKRWQNESMKAFRNPDVWLIINPRLAPVLSTNRTGEPDFAVRRDGWGWAGVDAKHHREMTGTSKPKEQLVSDLTNPKLEVATKVNIPGTHRLDDTLQLAHYHRMFVDHGLAPDTGEIWGGIIGTSLQVVWRRLDEPQFRNARAGKTLSALDYYEVEREFRLDVVEREVARSVDPSLPPLTRPEMVSACAECPWRTVCMLEMKEADEVSLLPGLTASRCTSLRAVGINTVSALSRLDHRTACLKAAKVDVTELLLAVKPLDSSHDGDPVSKVVTGTPAKRKTILQQLRKCGVRTVGDVRTLHAKTSSIPGTPAWLPRAIDQARTTRSGKVYLNRGVSFVGFPRAAIEVDIDFEDAEGYTYMFGMLVTGRKVSSNGDRKDRSEYRAFCSWDRSAEGEAKAFAEFWAELQRLYAKARANKWGFRSYFYTAHETHAIRTLAERHAGQPGVPTVAEVNAFMDSDRWIDLYPIITKDMIWPTSSYTVKSIAKHVRHTWTGEGANGALSLVWYEEAVSDPDPEVRVQRQRDLLTYNRQDNEATFKIREWITELSHNQRRPGDKLPGVDKLDRLFGPVK